MISRLTMGLAYLSVKKGFYKQNLTTNYILAVQQTRWLSAALARLSMKKVLLKKMPTKN